MTALEFILIGHPVGHSLSPVIHTAVYQRHDLPHRYRALDCPTADDVRAAVERLRSGEIAGANVTVPWKRLALTLADEADASARDTGAANVLARSDAGRVVAFNTDVAALRERIVARAAKPSAALEPPAMGSSQASSSSAASQASSSSSSSWASGESQASPSVIQAVVLGNGGAALAAVVACTQAGAAKVQVSARAWQEQLPRESWPSAAEFSALGAQCLAWSAKQRSELGAALADAGVIVQATSAGMLGHGGGESVVDLIPWQQLRSDVFLYDVVYNPPVTPFLQRARSLGLVAEGGLTMLVGQAALAIDIWLQIEAPRAEMTAAAERLLLGMPE